MSSHCLFSTTAAQSPVGSAVNTKVLGEDLKETVADLLAVLTAQSPYVSTSEPPLPEYVCQRYPNDGYKCAKGLLN